MAITPSNNTGRDRFGKNQPANYCGKPGRSGPVRENRNAIRHGLKAGKLPKGCQYIEIRLNSFRRQLEDSVMAAKGEVSLLDAAAIQTCLKWERHGCLAQRWLRLKETELKPNDLLQFSREIARASTERDKALATLELEAEVQQPWLSIPPADTPGNGDDK